MLSKEMKVEDTRWELMGKVSDWFNRNKIDIYMHIKKKHMDCATSPIWWIHIMVVIKLSCVATTNFKSLQVHHVTVTMQRTHIVYMQTYLLHAVGVDGPMSPSEAAAFDDL